MNRNFKISFRLLLTLIIFTLFTGIAFASPIEENIDVILNSVNIKVENQNVNTDNILYNGTTYAPLRDVSEILGKVVDWDNNTNTANIKGSSSIETRTSNNEIQNLQTRLHKNINITYNAVNIKVNGNKVNTDNILYNGTTYVPLRTISEMLGKVVHWDNDTNTASINSYDDLKVHYLDVGQGDSIFIELPNKENMLIDGGTRSNSDIVLNFLDNKNINTINYLVATHPHEDHIGGLIDVINKYDIEEIYMPDVVHTTNAFENLLLAINNKGYKINKAKSGDKLIESSKLNLYIIAPESNYKDNNLNNHSVVLKLDYINNSFIFTGDAERESENKMVDSNFNLNSDVLKVGHHGSDTSTTDKFLIKVNPKYAVISCGLNNNYGHPNDSVLSKLRTNNIEVFRTDLDGTIVASSNGNTITFNKSPKKPVPNKEKQSKPVINNNQEVFITKTGSKYHRGNCGFLSRSKIPIKLSDSIKRYEPCKRCNPPSP